MPLRGVCCPPENADVSHREDTLLSTPVPFFAKHLTSVLALLFLAGIAFFLALLAFVFVWLELPQVDELGKWGQLGDFFGGTLNPLFGFLAFSAILITLYIQKHELSLTLGELKQARAVAQDSERISRLHAQLSAMSQILEIKRKQADEAMKNHGIVSKEKSKNGRQTQSPFDEYFFSLHSYLNTEVFHYADRIEKVLEELGGAPAPTADQRAALNSRLMDELERIRNSQG